LFPNQFVNVRLILQQKQDALVIAAAALQTGSQGNFVYLLKHGRPPADPIAAKNSGGAAVKPELDKAAYYVEARPVKVELTEGTQVVLSAGVEQGDMVVVDGQEKLKNGSAVVPRQAVADGATAEVDVADAAMGQSS